MLKGQGDDPALVRRMSTAAIESAVVDQLRALLRQPEVIVGTWRAARAEARDLTETEVREALERLDPLWEELFPAEQAGIVRLLVERVEIGPDGADIRLRDRRAHQPSGRAGRRSRWPAEDGSMTAVSQTLTVRVPLAIRRHGGRKVIITPEHQAVNSSPPQRTRADPTLVKALASAHRWKRLLESGRYASISEMASAEKIDRGYLGRILLLALLAPDIVEARWSRFRWSGTSRERRWVGE